MDDAMDLVAPDGGLWIRRQVFEHSVSSATLLGPSTAARIDFPRLAAALAAASVTMHPDEPPAVTYSSWAAVAEELAHLASPSDADLIIEALETNAPSAFVRCNDLEKLAPGRQVDYRHLLIPVPELLAFLKLHAAAALAARFRETADAVWPASLGTSDVPVDRQLQNPSSVPMEQAPGSPEPTIGRLAGSGLPGVAASSLSPIPIPPVSNLNASGQEGGLGSPTATTPKIPQSPQAGHSPHARQQGGGAGVASPSLGAGGPADGNADVAASNIASGSAGGVSLSPPMSGQPPVLSPTRASVTPPSGIPSLTLRSPGGRTSNTEGGGGEGTGHLSRKKAAPHSPMINSPSAIVASVSHSLQRETHLVAQVLPALLTCIAGAYGVVAEVPQSPGRGSASGSLAASPRATKAKDGTPRTPSPLPLSHLARSGAAERDGDMEDPGRAGACKDGSAAGEAAEDSPVRDRQLLSKAGIGVGGSGMADVASDSTLSDLDGGSSIAKAGGGSAMMGTALGSKANFAGFGGTFSGSGGASDSSTGQAQSANSIMITRSLFEHLSFLLTTAASADGDKHLPIYTIVPEWRDPSCTDPVPLGRLVELTTAALTTMSADLESGPIDTAEIRDLERKTIIRSQLPATSVDPTEFPHGREVRITNCCDANVYLLCSLGRVSLIACRDCVLFVGSCVSVSVINCERVKVHTVARVCRVTNCFDSEIYLCTNRRPQVVGDCRGILFGPYNAAYPHIQRDVAAVGVDPARNLWDQYFRPSASRERSSAAETDLSPAVVSALPPERFFPFAVPVVADCDERPLSGPGDASDGFGDRDPAMIAALMRFDLPLPAEYQAAVDERRQVIEVLLKEVNKLDTEIKGDVAMSDSPTASEVNGTGIITPPSGLSSPPSAKTHVGQGDGQPRAGSPGESTNPRAHVQCMIQERFRAWLVSSNNMRQVVDLAKMERDLEAASANRMDGSPEFSR